MNITNYFIKHPVTAIILNLAIVLIGFLCFKGIGIREYPGVVLPKLVVETFYPNASAELVETSVTNILEDELAGVEGVDYITSESMPNMSLITINFRPNFSIEKAKTGIREAINLAQSKLPDEVDNPVINSNLKNLGPPFMAICLESEYSKFSELTHYANVVLKNSFRSLPGVASVEVWGRPYTYKIKLEHQKLYKFRINADEVYDAIASSSKSLPAGKFRKESPVTINTELETIEDIENILIKTKLKPVFLKDIAKIELGEEDQKFRLKINGNPGLCMGINKVSDENPLFVSENVHKQVVKLQNSLPENIIMNITLDQAEYVRSSIKNIESSILEAVFLVLTIVFLFLRNIRATLIPIVTIPISIIGSLLFLKFFGYSINIMTLLAMVLAVGLVVDDAIVVLENISRYIEEGETPLNAAIKGAKEIGFAIVAMTFTLTSVYLPIAFISGVTGQLFTEFAVCLAGSVLISGVTAITLSPLMCAKLIKPSEKRLFPKIDYYLKFLEIKYENVLKKFLSGETIVLTLLFINLLTVAVMYKLLPKETVPKEDRSLVGVFVPAIPGKTIDHNEKNIKKVEAVIREIPEKLGSITFAFAQGGSAILPLKPKDLRKRSAEEIVGSLFPLMSSFPSADAWPWSWNVALPGVDDPSENNEVSLIISTTENYQNLLSYLNKIRDLAEEKKLFKSIRHDLKLDNLGYNIEIDKDMAARLKIYPRQISKTVEIFSSSDTSLSFKKDGILYPLTIEGDYMPWNLEELYLTNKDDKKISIGNIAKFIYKAEPESLSHYNQMRSARIKVELETSDNLVDVMKKLKDLAEEILPSSYQQSWYGIAKSYTENTSSTALLFLLSMLFIYAILAVQFDNFSDPLIILLTVPLACAGAMFAMYIKGNSLNIYSQVGLITLIGLITKHGILIVEFANQLQERGEDLLSAVYKAAILRLRPILMTSSAMIAGSVPLILSNSAGSEAREAIGIVLVFGLGFGTLFTLFVLPGFYLISKQINKNY